MAWQRQGTCEWCGQCCGSMDSPNPANPWNTLPYRRLRWQWAQFEHLLKFASFVGLQESANGEVEIVQNYGSINIPSVGAFHWMWNPDEMKGGLWTDVEPYGEWTNNIPTCPFLMPADGEGKRECAFIQKPQYYNNWELTCGWRLAESEMTAEAIARWNPPEVMDDVGYAQWIADHPNCSFTWEEI